MSQPNIAKRLQQLEHHAKTDQQKQSVQILKTFIKHSNQCAEAIRNTDFDALEEIQKSLICEIQTIKTKHFKKGGFHTNVHDINDNLECIIKQ